MIPCQVNADKNFAFLEFRSTDEATKVRFRVSQSSEFRFIFERNLVKQIASESLLKYDAGWVLFCHAFSVYLIVHHRLH